MKASFKKLFKISALSIGLGALATGSALASNAAPAMISKAELGNYIHEYMLSHPELLVQMAQKLRMQQMQKASQAAQKAVFQNHNLLVNDPNALQQGNPKAPLTIVEFFDYQCSACAATFPQLQKFMQSPAAKNVRFVYRAFPFFGPASVYAAKATLAAEQQGKGIELHDALFKSGLIEGKLKQADVIKIAKTIKGLNIEKLKQAMQSKQVQDELVTNLKLVQAINLRATPGFVFVPTNGKQMTKQNTLFVNSALSVDQISQFVKNEQSHIK